MRRWTSLCAAVVALAAGVVALPQAATADRSATVFPVPGGGFAVVKRDAVGVPHVLSGTLRGVAYGFGRAFAADNLCALVDLVVTASGDRSRHFGAQAAPSPDLLAPFGTNLASDLYHRGVDQAADLPRLLAQPTPLGPSAEARQLVGGYVEGVNRHLRDRGAGRCAGWARPLVELDVWRLTHQFGVLGSSSLAPGVLAAAPPGARATARAGGPVADPGDGFARFVAARADAAAGSNAVAVGRDASATGRAMVLGNPHFPWFGNGRFYRMRLTVPGLLDAAGAAPFGVPVVGLGYNRDVAWTHTVSSAVPFVLHKLALDPADPTAYLVDGESRKMRAERVEVPTTAGPVTRTLYRSEHGPIVLLDAAHGWTSATAYALADANAANLRQIDTFLAESRSRSVDDIARAHARWQGVPFFTTVAADSSGRVRFDATSVTPNVTDAHAARCVAPADLPYFGGAGLAILDGSTASCAPATDRDAVAPGIFGPSRLPQLTRTDWVANSNDSPWLTNPAAPLAYPRILGDTATPRNLRTRFGATELARSGKVDATDLARLVLDDTVHSATLARADLPALCRAVAADLRPACDVLLAWSGKADVDSRGTVLWQEFWRQLQSVPGQGWRIPFDPAAPLTTPSGLRSDDLAVHAALARAVRSLGARPDVPLGEVQRSGTIPIHGCAGGTGCYNAISARGGQVASGTSYLFVATTGRHGTTAKTLLTYSGSTDPASPHAQDQTVLFSRKHLLDDRVG